MTQVSQCAGGIVIFQDQVLVIHQNANSWSLPKGHCDPGEDVEFTARREIAEESGVSALDLITPLGTYARHKLALGGGDDLRELKEITMFLYRALSPRLGSIEPQSRPVWVHHSVVADLLSHPKDRAFYKSQMDTVVAHISPAVWQVTTTTPNEAEAQALSEQLVSSRLAICVQINGPVHSRYRWEGQVEVAQEWQVIIKCQRDSYPAVERAIVTAHSYTAPQVTAIELSGGSLAYLKYIENH